MERKLNKDELEKNWREKIKLSKDEGKKN